jgi:HAD superfamily hydrolase (TIGR01458 family)
VKTPLLIDMDGVLRLGKTPAESAAEFLSYIRSSNRKSCILSNSTLVDSTGFKKFFDENSIECAVPIMTTVDATLNFVQKKYKRVQIYCNDNIKSLFDEFVDDDNPEAVIVGDIGKAWDFEILNNIFKKVLSGTDFIAMHKNKFWNTPKDGLLLDAGSFIKAIEFAVGREALLIGKPSPLYFQSALEILRLDRTEKFLMLGDDLETDIIGAQKLDSKAILVYTGKTDKMMAQNSLVKPDYEADNLVEVIELLEKLN